VSAVGEFVEHFGQLSPLLPGVRHGQRLGDRGTFAKRLGHLGNCPFVIEEGTDPKKPRPARRLRR
jgi:hypothetical protein